jgi:hypothetical protein
MDVECTIGVIPLRLDAVIYDDQEE